MTKMMVCLLGLHVRIYNDKIEVGQLLYYKQQLIHVLPKLFSCNVPCQNLKAYHPHKGYAMSLCSLHKR
jgi:hypothetical protein